MTDPVENQPHQLHTLQENGILAGDEDPLIQQSTQVDAFIQSLQREAYKRYVQPLIDDSRNLLDGHTGGETIQAMFNDEETLKQGTEKIVYEVFDHEINNLINMMRHTLFLSDQPAVPEDQWGDPETAERQRFERDLAQAWKVSNTKLNQLKEALRIIHGKQKQTLPVAAIIDDTVRSAYVGIYIDQNMLYPHHLIDVNTLRTISGSMQNVKRLFLARPEERGTLLTEMNQSKVRIGDFIDIFPDRHMYSMSGNLDRELNQFEINLFFEMLHNAKKYKVAPTDPIEIFVHDDGHIDVKNRSKQRMNTELTAFGTRGNESLEQKGNGFGIFKMKAIAGMTEETIEFSSDTIDDEEPPLFVITCSLKKAA